MKKTITISLLLFLASAQTTHTMREETSNKKPLTHNQFAKEIYNTTLTDEQLTIFAKKLLQQRIDYWKKELNIAENKNDSRAITKIPLYIRLKRDITPDDMLLSCSVVTEKMKNKDDNKTNVSGVTIISKKDLPRVIISISSYHKRPILVLNTLLHELTHVEQNANAEALKPLIKKPFNQICCHEYAQFFYKNKDDITNIIVDNYANERSAEHGSFKFCHNPKMLHKTYEKIHKNKKKTSNEITTTITEQKGYFSAEERRKFSKEYADEHYKEYPEKLFEDELQETLWSSQKYFTSKKIHSSFFTNEKLAYILGMYLIIRQNYKIFNSPKK